MNHVEVRLNLVKIGPITNFIGQLKEEEKDGGKGLKKPFFFKGRGKWEGKTEREKMG